MEPNSTIFNSTLPNEVEADDSVITNEMKIAWICGIVFSTFGLLLQIFLYVVVACSRKMDQKILTQMTVARYLNVIFEYFVMNVQTPKVIGIIILTLYVQMDAALICWMFVFTKNLYDKVVVVFNKRMKLMVVSICIWVCTLPVGMLVPILIEYDYFDNYYLPYSIVKFVILLMNLLFFCRIFWIASTRKSERQLKRFVRTCITSFLLVCITSLQVFIGDLLSFIGDYTIDTHTPFIFSTINSYEAIAMTILFVILVDSSTEDSLMKNLQRKFRNNSGV